MQRTRRRDVRQERPARLDARGTRARPCEGHDPDGSPAVPDRVLAVVARETAQSRASVGASVPGAGAVFLQRLRTRPLQSAGTDNGTAENASEESRGASRVSARGRGATPESGWRRAEIHLRLPAFAPFRESSRW